MEQVIGENEIEIPDAVVDWLEANLSYKNGALKRRSNGHAVDRTKVNALLMAEGHTELMTQPQWEYYRETKELAIRNARQNLGTGWTGYETHNEFVLAHWMAKGIQVDEQGAWTMGTDTDRFATNLNAFVDALVLGLVRYNRNIPEDEEGNRLIQPLKETKEMLMIATAAIQEQREQDRISKVREMLAYRPEAEFPLTEWATELLTTYGLKENIPESVEALKHMLWSIKRGIWMREIPLPLFYTFHSKKQGIGKTRLIQEFAAQFLFAYNGSANLAQLLDSNNMMAQTRGRWLIDFQELAVGGRGHKSLDGDAVAALKQAITTPYIAGRTMFHHSLKVEKNYSVMCSSTNVHIWDVIRDGTGMRRYFEFVLDPDVAEPYKGAKGLLACITDAYRAIDENDAKGYVHDEAPIMPAISAIQESYAKREDLVSRFLRMNGWTLEQGDEDDTAARNSQGFSAMKLTNFHDAFCRWLRENKEDERHWSSTRIRLVLEAIPIHTFSKTNPKGGQEDYLWVKKAVVK